jgi:hypothetical protein
MTSEINFLSINANFPVPGEDNDTQVFRDNFDTIKTSLETAQSEITDLQNNTAKLNEENDFAYNVISRATLQNTFSRRFDGGIIGSPTTQMTIDYENGGYQIFRFSSGMLIDFQNLPENTNPSVPAGVGKMTLELYGDGTARTLQFIIANGAEFRKANWPTDFPSTDNKVIVQSTTEPVIIEVWRHNVNYIFMNYLGRFVA